MTLGSWYEGSSEKIPAIGRALAVALAAAALVFAFMSHASAAQADQGLAAARFSLSIDGFEIAAFPELQAVSSEARPLESGPSVQTARVVLRRGMNSSIELWSWHEAALTGDIVAYQKNAVLTAYSPLGAPVARYHLENAWPSKIEIGALKAGASEVLMETVTIVCERLQRVSP